MAATRFVWSGTRSRVSIHGFLWMSAETAKGWFSTLTVSCNPHVRTRTGLHWPTRARIESQTGAVVQVSVLGTWIERQCHLFEVILANEHASDAPFPLPNVCLPLLLFSFMLPSSALNY